MSGRQVSRIGVVLAVAAAVAVPLLLSSCERQGAKTAQETSAGKDSETTTSPVTEDLLWGRFEPDSYPRVVEPAYVDAETADGFLEDDDPVFVVRFPDAIFVYPELLLSLHQVINEDVDGEAVAVTTCSFSGSAVLYSREHDGRTLTLGVTGQLYLGNSVLHDEETGTRWLQLTGKPIIGDLAGGPPLTALRPLAPIPWSRVRGIDSLNVLAPRRKIGVYREFHERMTESRLGLRALREGREPDGRLPPFSAGTGLLAGPERSFVPDALLEDGLVNERVGDVPVVCFVDPRVEMTQVFLRTVRGRTLSFTKTSAGLMDLETESRWTFDGLCIAGDLEGSRLGQPDYRRAFWFAWATFFPETDVTLPPRPPEPVLK